MSDSEPPRVLRRLPGFCGGSHSQHGSDAISAPPWPTAQSDAPNKRRQEPNPRSEAGLTLGRFAGWVDVDGDDLEFVVLLMED